MQITIDVSEEQAAILRKPAPDITEDKAAFDKHVMAMHFFGSDFVLQVQNAIREKSNGHDSKC